jgi:hypothetical protein
MNANERQSIQNEPNNKRNAFLERNLGVAYTQRPAKSATRVQLRLSAVQQSL